MQSHVGFEIWAHDLEGVSLRADSLVDGLTTVTVMSVSTASEYEMLSGVNVSGTHRVAAPVDGPGVRGVGMRGVGGMLQENIVVMLDRPRG